MKEVVVDWSLVNKLVAPEHQYRHVKNPPIDPVRMAWPFKTEGELYLLSQWYKKQQKSVKEKQIQEHIDQHGKAFL